MRRRLPDILILALLFALPLVMFWAQTVGGRTLIPAENLFQFEPYAAYREQVGAPAVPHNMLVLDLLVENYQWKTFTRSSLAAGEIPLWNPHQFSGIPFLAAGQHSALYPPSLIYYLLPLPSAYGWFTVVQLWLAGAFTYAFLRGLGRGRFGSALAGIVYQLSAFFVISAVFQMVIAAAAWIPLVLLMVECVIRQRPALGGQPASAPWVTVGAAAIGFGILAGHVEITYYTLIITAYYTAFRLAWEWRSGGRDLRFLAGRAGWLLLMSLLGAGLGAIQFVPLAEVASINFRDGKSSLEQVLGWAHPLRDLIQFALPNFYGSAAHHTYFDIFSGQMVPATVNALGQPITTIDWGIKNTVEAALYVGILPLFLSAYALLDGWRARRGSPPGPPYRLIFALLTLVALTFMFGLPTYALLYYGLPGINQLHSPFRWVLAVTLGVAVLAGFGADALARRGSSDIRSARAFSRIALGLALLTFAGLVIIRLAYPQVEPLIDRVFRSMAKATEAFADARMFTSYQFTNLLVLGVMLAGTAAVFFLARRDFRLTVSGRRVPLFQPLALGLVAADLMIASWGFNPASDPALLDFRPPVIAWLEDQPGYWRYTSLDDPGQRPLLTANLGWRYGLDDIRGYESIIPRQYVEFMKLLAPQLQLDYNRVAPLYTVYPAELSFAVREALNSPLLDLLNVRYVLSHKSTTITERGWALAYEDEAVRIWERQWTILPNGIALKPLPRAYTVAASAFDTASLDLPHVWTAALITADTGRELLLDVDAQGPSWLVVSQTYLPGWRAFVRPVGAGEREEQPLETALVKGNLTGVYLPDAGLWTVRLVYSPTSFQLGLFGSFISGIVLIFALGVYLWRLYIMPRGGTSGAAVVARNSAAPIILSLFNRGIDFGFAVVMLRILGPENAGIYTYAAFIFGWFDIFTNFGLNVFLTREVAREPARAWRTFYNTSALRLLLMVVGVVLLAAFLLGRQSLPGADPLTEQAILAIVLLYIGLLPNSLSTGMSALFYGFQRAEYPAAISTISTISKAVLGVAALALGYGVVGLAAVSIITNLVTLIVMVYTGRDLLRPGEGTARAFRPERKLMRGMLGEGFPLMLNHFLATIFFQIDVVIIQTFHGDTMVGQYSVAYKWVAALNVIPAFFTMALLPVMSRQAREDKAALKVNYGLAIKLLFSTAVPIAIVFTFLAYVLTGILGGSEFLPDGAIATQLMIWSIPIGWMNSLTQYVLIALDLQRRITRAFVLAVSFNIISNLILIPSYGYRAAALTTIASELTLLIPFALLLRSAVGSVNWLSLIWKPTSAGVAMLVVLLLGWSLQPALALVVGVLVYLGVMLMLRPLNVQEWDRLAPLLPGRLRRLARLAGAQFTS